MSQRIGKQSETGRTSAGTSPQWQGLLQCLAFIQGETCSFCWDLASAFLQTLKVISCWLLSPWTRKAALNAPHLVVTLTTKCYSSKGMVSKRVTRECGHVAVSICFVTSEKEHLGVKVALDYGTFQ